MIINFFVERRRLLFIPLLISVLLLLSFSCKKNIAPTCTITSPKNNDLIVIGEKVNILVDAYDTDGDITEVQFFIDGSNVSTDTQQPYNYQWNTSDEQSGKHTIKATVIDNNASLTDDEIIVLAGNRPGADFTCSVRKVNEGESIIFTDQSTYDPISWSWDFGDGETSTSQNPSHVYSIAGTYSVSLTVTNSYGPDLEEKIDYIIVNGTVTDYDGNVYKTVQIGDQIWMAENLKTTHYSNGWAIGLVERDDFWERITNSSVVAYCYYHNSSLNGDIYGALYNWNAAMNRQSESDNNPSGVQGVCPDGWHLPRAAEWTELIDYLGGPDVAGGKMKEIGLEHWDVPNNHNATNESGFTALGTGRRHQNGSFQDLKLHTNFWSTTVNENSSAYVVGVYNKKPLVFLGVGNSNYHGYSVRCIKNSE